MVRIPPHAELHADCGLGDTLCDLVDILDAKLRVNLPVGVHFLQGEEGFPHLGLDRTVNQLAIFLWGGPHGMAYHCTSKPSNTRWLLWAHSRLIRLRFHMGLIPGSPWVLGWQEGLGGSPNFAQD